jgi:hypothetical protein
MNKEEDDVQPTNSRFVGDDGEGVTHKYPDNLRDNAELKREEIREE